MGTLTPSLLTTSGPNASYFTDAKPLAYVDLHQHRRPPKGTLLLDSEANDHRLLVRYLNLVAMPALLRFSG
jgi:hypothetical protein